MVIDWVGWSGLSVSEREKIDKESHKNRIFHVCAERLLWRTDFNQNWYVRRYCRLINSAKLMSICEEVYFYDGSKIVRSHGKAMSSLSLHCTAAHACDSEIQGTNAFTAQHQHHFIFKNSFPAQQFLRESIWFIRWKIRDMFLSLCDFGDVTKSACCLAMWLAYLRVSYVSA